MRTISGIDFEDNEVRHFQGAFLGTESASAIGKILDSLSRKAMGIMKDPQANEKEWRIAQGMGVAIEEFDTVVAAISQTDLNEDEQGDTIDENEEADDVGQW